MLAIRTMTAADLPQGMRLVAQAGWNQLPADWERFLAMEPAGCLAAEVDGQLVGTTVACLFGPVAWLAMVLVDEPQRGRGIGRALVEHALAWVDERGAPSVRLDATPLGQPLYEKLGFAPQFALTRFAGRLPEAAAPLAMVKPALAGDDHRLFAYDGEVTHTDRRKFLSRLLAEDRASARVLADPQQVHGWMTVRRGRLAWQLGPCLGDREAGEALLDDAAARLAGKEVFFDAPVLHAGAQRWAERRGLTPRRTLVRMCRGAEVCEDLKRLWGSSGPELG